MVEKDGALAAPADLGKVPMLFPKVVKSSRRAYGPVALLPGSARRGIVLVLQASFVDLLRRCPLDVRQHLGLIPGSVTCFLRGGRLAKTLGQGVLCHPSGGPGGHGLTGDSMDRTLWLVAASLLIVGCSEMEPVELESASLPIIGGTVETGYPAVGMVFSQGGELCTGTLITSRMVITAGHCASPSNPPKWFATGPSINTATATYDVSKSIRHPSYGESGSGVQNDIALLVLAQNAAATPMKYRTESISTFKGKNVTFVGYGISQVNNDYSSGTKMKVTVTIDSIESKGFWNYTSSYNPKNTCQGDSGGPGFVTTDGVQEVVGLVSYGDENCTQNGYNTRVDAYAAWIAQVVQQNDPGAVLPACGNGTCDSGETSATCPADCGGGATIWTPCASSSECTSGLCLQVQSGSFCSQYCAEPESGSGCPPSYLCVALQSPPANGDGACVFTGTGSQCGNGKCETGENYDVCAADCIVSGCGVIEDIGCCDQNTLVWCEGGKLLKINCSDTKCGWDATNGYYNCSTAGGQDPSGSNPRSCLDVITAPVCGDGKCESGETSSSCPSDCKPDAVCGNGTCEAGESSSSCPADCGSAAVCGNGSCESGETQSNCPADCKAASACGNGVCETGETLVTCPSDCSTAPSCGDGICNGGENFDACAADCAVQGCGDYSAAGCCDGTVVKWCDADILKMIDCGSRKCGWNMESKYYDCDPTAVEDTSGLNPRECSKMGAPLCGDGKCEGDEAGSCPADCGPSVAVCGDGVCSGAEDKEKCPADCAASCGDGVCSEAEKQAGGCSSDCGGQGGCGDGVCGDEEWCGSCSQDCGPCVNSSGCSAGLVVGVGAAGKGSMVLMLAGLLILALGRTMRRKHE